MSFQGDLEPPTPVQDEVLKCCTMLHRAYREGKPACGRKNLNVGREEKGGVSCFESGLVCGAVAHVSCFRLSALFSNPRGSACSLQLDTALLSVQGVGGSALTSFCHCMIKRIFEGASMQPSGFVHLASSHSMTPRPRKAKNLAAARFVNFCSLIPAWVFRVPYSSAVG